MKILEKIILLGKALHPVCLKRLAYQLQITLEDHVLPHLEIKSGTKTTIHPLVNFKVPKNIIIGSHVRIQSGVFLWASNNSKIVIGNYSGIGPGTQMFSSNHKYEGNKKYIQQEWIERDIIIGSNVWIGANSIIASGVNINDNCVVAAGSVVTKSFPENSLIAGNPARIIREISRE